MAWAETPFLHSRSAIVYDIGRRVVLLEKNAALREIEVLAMLADGRGNEEIARQPDIPDNMVKSPFSSIFGKLGAINRIEAVRLGMRHGFIMV